MRYQFCDFAFHGRSQLEVVVHDGDLTIEQERGILRSESRDEFVEHLDEPGPIGLKGEIPLAIPVGVSYDGDTTGHGIRLRAPVSVGRMATVAFGTDETSPLTTALIEEIRELGHDPLVLAEGDPWPDTGRAVADAVAQGVADWGVVCCWTGTGVSIAANKVAGVRAALCSDAETARGARQWNDANVLAIGLRLTSFEVGREMLEAFASTEADPEEAAQIAKLT